MESDHNIKMFILNTI